MVFGCTGGVWLGTDQQKTLSPRAAERHKDKLVGKQFWKEAGKKIHGNVVVHVFTKKCVFTTTKNWGHFFAK